MPIQKVHARQIFDSRGNPTVEATGLRKLCFLLWVFLGALIITYTILGVPYYDYSIMGPETLF